MGEAEIGAFYSGTLAGAGSFRCEACGFAIALHALDPIPACPHCDGGRFKRSSIFGEHADAEALGTRARERPPWLQSAEALLRGRSGHFLLFEYEGEVRVAELQDGWSRIGRSLAAHVRFDDPTVSRRHALIHRADEGVRLLDDRSLNGVFRNGERVDLAPLEDGDEMLVGRFRLFYRTVEAAPAREGERASTTVD